jgi:hypothetical protein
MPFQGRGDNPPTSPVDVYVTAFVDRVLGVDDRKYEFSVSVSGTFWGEGAYFILSYPQGAEKGTNACLVLCVQGLRLPFVGWCMPGSMKGRRLVFCGVVYAGMDEGVCHLLQWPRVGPSASHPALHM